MLRKTFLLHMIVFLAALTILAGCSGPAKSTQYPPVITVALDGSGDHTSIEEAVDDAPEGAIIKIKPGDYVGSVIIDKPLTLEGTGWELTSLSPPGATKEGIEKAAKKMSHEMHFAKTREERNKVRQKMMTKIFKPPLLIENTVGVEIRGLRISQLPSNKDLYPLGPFALGYVNASGRIVDCAVVGSTRDGIHVIGDSDVEIDNCFVAAAWGEGIVVFGITGNDAHPRARIYDSEVRNCRHYGVVIRHAGTDVSVTDCRIGGTAWHAIRIDDCSPKIERNVLNNNARFGIYTGRDSAAIVRNNLLLKNGMAGMMIEPECDNLIENNTFARNERESIVYLGSSTLHAQNNVFFENAGTISWKINNNIKAKAEDFARLLSGPNVFWKNKTRDDYMPVDGKNCVVLEPRFKVDSAEDADYKLAPDFKMSDDVKPGAKGFPAVNSPWPLQPEEEAIIPPPHTRDYRYWTDPVQLWNME